MTLHGYEWEAHEVHTEDKYILTLFRVLGRTDASLGSVLVQHGAEMDGASWLKDQANSKPF